MRSRLLELARFGTVGGAAFVVDVGMFNLLRYGPGELLDEKPLTAKALSVAVAMLAAWLGNRYWTFAGRRTGTAARELLAFVLVNVGGMGIAVGCLAFSHYLLGFTSPLADNIAANVVGLGLGTAFRYVAYRRWVFTGIAGAPGPLVTVPSEMDLPQDGLDRTVDRDEAYARSVGGSPAATGTPGTNTVASRP